MKKLRFLLVFALIFALSTAVLASEDVPLSDAEALQSIYDSAYQSALNAGTVSYEAADDDYKAYACLLSHMDAIQLENNVLSVDEEVLELDCQYFLGFVSKLNVLLDKGAIQLDDNFKIYVKEAPTAEDATSGSITPFRLPVFDLMSLARIHADDLQEVYDNAAFGTAHITAGIYFYERVKSGGVWDYKDPLGTNTLYYEPTLGENMTGETIGNFHYGYVGSVVFEPETLKTAAGLAQIFAGTSDFSYWDSYFDDPRDQANIQWGIDTYNLEH